MMESMLFFKKLTKKQVIFNLCKGTMKTLILITILLLAGCTEQQIEELPEKKMGLLTCDNGFVGFTEDYENYIGTGKEPDNTTTCDFSFVNPVREESNEH